MQSDGYIPPFAVSNKAIDLISEISERIGAITVTHDIRLNPQLRRENRIRTIQASLAIENNTLSLKQVTDVIDGKRVLGPPKDIREVKNAYDAYEQALHFDPYAVEDMLAAHRMLMADLIDESGAFRKGGVGVFNGERLVHMAPPAERVPQLVHELLEWVRRASAHPLIKSSVFHYEFEFIHPFADGNGRMGRMWQTLLLYRWKPLFAWLPVETLVKEHQEECYKVLSASDKAADSGAFIEFMLSVIRDTLREIT